MILIVTIQFRLHEGQLISRIQKTDKRYILGQGKKRPKLLKKLYCRVLLIPITVLPKKKRKKKKKKRRQIKVTFMKSLREICSYLIPFLSHVHLLDAF